MKNKMVIAVIVFSGILTLYFYGRGLWHPVYTKVRGVKNVADVMAEYGPLAEPDLRKKFKEAGAVFPPEKAALLAVKDERIIELWAGSNGKWTYISEYPILAASGVSGPKLREGDRQVPEGIYRITGLNPNSSYHLSMKLNYPNAFDLKNATLEGRTAPGSDIFIHGKSVSIGCLAIGDAAIEALFVLVGIIGVANTEVIIAPGDPRKSPLIAPEGSAQWVNELYHTIERSVMRFQGT
ncbi:hypothetical protein DENIS_0747 [Desulfonema ishimotonii]|uniref:L,D-TPase catalytic domain-containing protein n=1 Tax=Desulfonema ishimotonii TaxID=45657 RepID=A0A401FS68_9BACT|nr:L,D-transpeptidase family protein [Desulfonema ishimotonii]GBC59806.1 hypothetical protein DENIS_0747 [Desulfonema ishimotonii]